MLHECTVVNIFSFGWLGHSSRTFTGKVFMILYCVNVLLLTFYDKQSFYILYKCTVVNIYSCAWLGHSSRTITSEASPTTTKRIWTENWVVMTPSPRWSWVACPRRPTFCTTISSESCSETARRIWELPTREQSKILCIFFIYLCI